MNDKSVPRIDRLAGIECYCTNFQKLGGSIKKDNEGFRVSEIINESILTNLSPFQDSSHRYPLYILEKKGIDSHHALLEVRKDLGLELRVMGMKDAKATTRQYASSIQAHNIPKQQICKTKHTSLKLNGFTTKPLGKESLLGNDFSVTIYDAKHSEMSEFKTEVEKVANFYGLQRFGSERLVTHLVGREIVKHNFTQAVELLLSYSTEFDTQTSREIRNKCADPRNYQQVLKMLPRGMDIERQVLSALVGGSNAISALRAIPIMIRRLFVQAYQAYIFNRCLSKA